MCCVYLSLLTTQFNWIITNCHGILCGYLFYVWERILWIIGTFSNLESILRWENQNFDD